MNPKNQAITNQAVPADTPQPAPTPVLTPEEVVEGLRALRTRIGDVTPLTRAQRRLLRSQVRTSNPVLQASINVIGALDTIAQAVGMPAAEVRQMHDEANRWTAVEDELRTLLNGVAGANLIRRQRISLVATQAASIGSQLARSPAHAVLVPHVQELKRLKSFTRRRKTAAAPPPAAGSGAPQAHEPGGEQA
ncbi:MAG TPA: hypothetical protein VN605_11550 [Thermoanaerobaculia bacterium]|nr:hypothetical protein [Thermoanaerobaculia bacterium]